MGSPKTTLDRPIRVVIAEDAFLAREAIEQVLERSPEVEVVAEFADRYSLLEGLERQRPDALVTDIRMPPTGTDEGIQVARTVREIYPLMGVVVLSQYVEPGYALALLEAGSQRRAYLLKERIHDGEQLVRAIKTVTEGGSVVDPKVVDALVEARAQNEPSALSELSERELEVLAQIAQGKSNSAIAASLFLTKRAVEKHINSIFLKLDLRDADDVSHRVKATLMFLADQQAEAGRMRATP
jgi:DNA-binding NarL/FixJ family response regulator